jgi:hypothetical protein
MSRRRNHRKNPPPEGYGFHVVADPTSTTTPASIVGAIVTGPVAPFFEGVLGPSFDAMAAALHANTSDQIASIKASISKTGALKKPRRRRTDKRSGS